MHQKLGKITLFYVVLDVSQGSEHGFEMGKKTVTSWNQFSYGEKTVWEIGHECSENTSFEKSL